MRRLTRNIFSFGVDTFREIQRLHKSIRGHKERLHFMEVKLKDIRKGKGGMVRSRKIGYTVSL